MYNFEQIYRHNYRRSDQSGLQSLFFTWLRWGDIRNNIENLDTIAISCDECPLCSLYRVGDCGECLLCITHNGCGEANSPWSKVRDARFTGSSLQQIAVDGMITALENCAKVLYNLDGSRKEEY